MSPPRLTVTLTNYNGRHLLEPMLASLAAQSFQDFAIAVVDDGSRDDSVVWLRTQWPHVRVVELRGNSGVTAAMNAALQSADTELVALFNNDMELEPECLTELVASLDEYAGAGSATPKMLDFARREILDGAGDELNWRGGGGRRGHGESDRGQYDEPQEVFGPCGGAVLFRRSALQAVGLFDPAYFAYYEDVDWAFRARLQGLGCRYVPSAVLYHRGSETLGRGMSDFNTYQLWRNPIWLIAKCYPAATLARHAPDIVVGQAGNLAAAVRERKLRVWLRAMRDALLGVPGALRKRREIQRTRTVTAAELERAARRVGP